MKVLVACEFSGVVATEFAVRGHYAVHCDIIPRQSEVFHTRRFGDMPKYYHGDVADILDEEWDLIIAHPPCTYLAVSGNRYYSARPDLYEPAAKFAMGFFDYAPKVCVENPVGRLSRLFRKPDQIIQPWQFGHPESKKTCLWLKGLPKLEPTDILPVPDKGYWNNQTPSGQNKLGPSKDRANIRSITYKGIAKAMAEQWGKE